MLGAMAGDIIASVLRADVHPLRGNGLINAALSTKQKLPRRAVLLAFLFGLVRAEAAFPVIFAASSRQGNAGFI